LINSSMCLGTLSKVPNCAETSRYSIFKEPWRKDTLSPYLRHSGAAFVPTPGVRILFFFLRAPGFPGGRLNYTSENDAQAVFKKNSKKFFRPPRRLPNGASIVDIRRKSRKRASLKIKALPNGFSVRRSAIITPRSNYASRLYK